MWNDLMAALALVLVIEGMLPFIKPEAWKKAMGRIALRSDHTLRWMGLMSMMAGVILLSVIRQA